MEDQLVFREREALQQPALLTIPEVAAWVRVNAKTVYRWIKDGKLPAFKLGPRLYRVERTAVEDFLAASGYGYPPAPGRNGDGARR